MTPNHDSPLDQAMKSDAERVVREYARRAADDRLRGYNSRVAPAMERAAADRHCRILAVADSIGPRAAIRLLDVGCGRGGDLAALRDAGLVESNLAGADLITEDIEIARILLPSANLVVANAARLPWQGQTFDIVMQTVMLSSVIDPVVRRSIAQEMERLVRPGGRLISYDLTGVTDRNPHLVPIDNVELRRLFSDRQPSIERITLYLPLASRVPGWLAGVLAQLPFLRRHIFAVMERPGVPDSSA